MAYKIQKLSEISYNQIKRIPTGFKELDLIFGESDFCDAHNNPYKMIGPPRGTISLWAGEAGVGKSRACTSICTSVSEKYGFQVIYMINEDSAENLRRWAPKDMHEDNFYVVSDCDNVDEQIKIIDNNYPDLVVIDSLNMMVGINNIDDLKTSISKWRDVAQEVDCHIILISHMNKKGEVKGSTDISHLVDIVCTLKKLVPPKDLSKYDMTGYFYLQIGKNRYGPSGGVACFKHNENGVSLETSILPKR